MAGICYNHEYVAGLERYVLNFSLSQENLYPYKQDRA